MSLPTSPLRLLPTAATFVRWDSHPLEFRAFSRRTELIRLRRVKMTIRFDDVKKPPGMHEHPPNEPQGIRRR